MKRRRISLRGVPLSAQFQARQDARERLKARFNVEQSVLDRFIDYMLDSGWDESSIVSVAGQSTNFERPPIQTFLHGGGNAIDQVILNQGTYTEFRDSARDPNFALRFPSETETILRRLTPGDLIMLDAAQRVSALYPTMVDEHDAYWRSIWQAIYYSLFREPVTVGRVHPHERAFDNPWLAALTSYATFLDYADNYSTDTAESQVYETFMRPNSRFYAGVSFQRERSRLPNSEQYVDCYRFTHVREADSLWFFACTLLCAAVDNYGRAVTSYVHTLTPWFGFTDRVRSVFARFLVDQPHYVECPIGVYANADYPQNDASRELPDRILRVNGRPDDGSE